MAAGADLLVMMVWRRESWADKRECKMYPFAPWPLAVTLKAQGEAPGCENVARIAKIKGATFAFAVRLLRSTLLHQRAECGRFWVYSAYG